MGSMPLHSDLPGRRPLPKKEKSPYHKWGKFDPSKVIPVAERRFPNLKQFKTTIYIYNGEIRLDIRVLWQGKPSVRGILFNTDNIEALQEVVEWALPIMMALKKNSIGEVEDLSHLLKKSEE